MNDSEIFKKSLRCIVLFGLTVALGSCSSFSAKRISSKKGDALSLKLTDKWVAQDSRNAIYGEKCVNKIGKCKWSEEQVDFKQGILKSMEKHKRLQKYLAKKENPKMFIAEIKNKTSEPYLPIDDFNQLLLTKLSSQGDFILIDEQARERLSKELHYQNNGMVKPEDVKKIGKQSGADVILFGTINSEDIMRGGKTLRQYSVNIRLTDVESGEEIARVRYETEKYSKQSGVSW